MHCMEDPGRLWGPQALTVERWHRAPQFPEVLTSSCPKIHSGKGSIDSSTPQISHTIPISCKEHYVIPQIGSEDVPQVCCVVQTTDYSCIAAILILNLCTEYIILYKEYINYHKLVLQIHNIGEDGFEVSDLYSTQSITNFTQQTGNWKFLQQGIIIILELCQHSVIAG